MIFTADFWLNCIILLINDDSQRTRNVVTELLESYEKDKNQAVSSDTDLANFYIRVVRLVMAEKIDWTDKDNLRMILLKLRTDPVVSSRRDVYDLLFDMFMARDSESDASIQKFDSVKKSVQNMLMFQRLNKQTRKLFGKLNAAAECVDVHTQYAELQSIKAHADSLSETFREVAAQAEVTRAERVDFTKLDSVIRSAEKRQTRHSSGIFRLGLHGWNRAYGKSRGTVRGESTFICGQSHNYKSGSLKSFLGWGAAYNTPISTSGRKPLIYMASLENNTDEDQQWIFEQRYIMEHGCRPPSDWTPADRSHWIFEFFEKRGWAVVMDRFQPTDFNFDTFVSVIRELEEAGYEVQMVVLDYLSKAEKMGSQSNASRHEYISSLCSLFCNYCKAKDIAFITGHQLTREAIRSGAGGKTNIVKQYDASHIEGSQGPMREPDVVIFVHLETNTHGVKFLTMYMPKHRYVDDTPEAHKYCAYPFIEGLGIIDDIGGPPKFVTDILSYDPDDVDGSRERKSFSLESASSIF